MERNKRSLLVSLVAGVVAAIILFLIMGTDGRGAWAYIIPGAFLIATVIIATAKYRRVNKSLQTRNRSGQD